MKTTIISILIFAVNLCYSQDTVFFDSKWRPTGRYNSEFYRIDKQENNYWIRTDYYFKTNQVQMRGNYSSLNPEIRDGYFEWYHPNGKLKHKGSYVKDNETGEHLWFTNSGTIEAKENYKNGQLDGEYEEYHPNGELMNKTSFHNGIQNGWTIFYRETGSKHSEGNHKNGNREGEWKYYDEKGKILGTTIFKTDYEIPEAGLFLSLPNDEWSLDSKASDKLIQYIFKRSEVTDSLGRVIIPAIMLYVEDAKDYKQDLVLYSINKRIAFKSKGIVVDRILSPDKEDYPLSFENSLITLTSYSDKGFNHILYMIHIITKDNKGIQIYMDMTKELVPDYENEFWTTIQSIKELK